MAEALSALIGGALSAVEGPRRGTKTALARFDPVRRALGNGRSGRSLRLAAALFNALCITLAGPIPQKEW
jgi:hypothetical protein